MVWCQWFGVNVGFGNEDRMLIDNLYVFKGYGAKKILSRNLLIKVAYTAGTKQTFEEAARNWKMKWQRSIDHELRERTTTLTFSCL